MNERTNDQVSGPPAPLALPRELRQRLRAFRRLVGRVKLAEAACAAACGVLVGYLVVFALDRIGEPPRALRVAAFLAAVCGCAAVPLAFRRWVWRQRALEQVARLVARRFPSMGDQLLGIIDIVRGGGAEGRSRTLCAAAVAQVADRARAYDFRQAVPPARLGLWALLAALPAVAAVALAMAFPEAAGNAWERFAAPWRAVDRFTFARIEPLPQRLVVPHGEPVPLAVGLRDDTRARPARASARLGAQPPLDAALDAGAYAFTLPPQLEETTLAVAAGDARQRARIAPLHRPEITALEAEVTLPDYLQRPGVRRQDVRGGTLAPVKGSSVSIVATASRELASAEMDGTTLEPQGPVVRTPPRVVSEETSLTLGWRDGDGLAGSQPLVLTIAPRSDEAPVVVALDLPASRDVLLNTDTLRFRVSARDDFGIRRVGLEWEGMSAWGDATAESTPVEKGERLLKPGGSDLEALEVAATFCPEALGIQPQTIVLRAFAEDYLPGRPRAYSSPLVIYVVDRAEHALVLNTRLQQFRQQASEVRDREMGLLAANKELRGLPEERLLDADTRGRLEAQAAAEETNARRLERLVEEGGKLVREALKNPEFEAATLEQLAEDIQSLADIAENRMPGVADLLGQAAQARRATAADSGQPGQPGRAGSPEDQAAGAAGKQGGGEETAPSKPSEQASAQPDAAEQAAGKGGDQEGATGEKPPQVGPQRGATPGQSGAPGDQQPPPVPQVVDVESSQQPQDPRTDSGGQQSASGSGRLGLPTTQAGVPAQGKQAEEPAAAEALDEAIAAQEALLAEFAKVADELGAVMARLEGSTFVKRFKLASREQGTIGSRIAGMAADAFGKDVRPAGVNKALGDIREMNTRETEKVSALMDDLQSYFDRRQLPAFRTVLEEMKELDALGSLRQLSDDIPRKTGMSIAQAEYWSDTFDRLADDLVPPPQSGAGQSGEGGQQQRESVPPEVVLEAMKILEDEVNLREETRVAEQTRPEAADFAAEAGRLAARQDDLADRVAELVDRLLDEPDGEQAFGPEIGLFEQVEDVMAEAAGILRTPDAGPKAIGAETEAIELLLAAQSGGGGGGGGGGTGGATPGGGGTGSTKLSALALVGRGNRTKAEAGGEKEQATGVSGRVLPEEFRAGLDAYFNRFEKERR